MTSPTTHVDDLPKLDGKTTDERGSKGPGLLHSEGRMGTLKGTVAVSLGEATLQGATGKLEVSVEQGKVRAYLRDGKNGYLVDTVEDCAQRCLELLRDPAGADEKGAAGREHVRQNFLSTRELEDWIGLFTSLSS